MQTGLNRLIAGFDGYKPKIGGLSVQQAVVYQGKGAGQHQPVEEHLGPVRPAVAVSVFQDRDPAVGRIFAVACNVRHITRHFNHPYPGAVVKNHRNRRLDQGFCSGN